MIGSHGGAGAPTCSRAGCSEPAAWNVNWRNPKIHMPDRVKIWLACDAHVDFLVEYLDARGFPVIASPLAEPATRVPDRGGPS